MSSRCDRWCRCGIPALPAMALLALVGVIATPLTARAAPARGDRRPTVAVLYFDYGGGAKTMRVLRKGLASMLISDLSTLKAVRIVERDRLQKLLGELKLNRSRVIDRRSANRLGRMLGARYMVLGSYFSLMSKLRIDAKVVRVETGAVVKSCGTLAKSEDFMAATGRLSQCLRRVLEARLVPFKARRRRRQRRTRAHARGARNHAASGKVAKAASRPRLNTATALAYARALDAKDRGDVKTARAELKKILARQPGFKLAARTLASLK